MKKRSAINLAVVIILTAAFGALAIFGLNIGALEIKPPVSGIRRDWICAAAFRPFTLQWMRVRKITQACCRAPWRCSAAV